MGLLAAFLRAFSILMPALYFPILLMLLGLICRGVAFEFRLRPRTSARSGRRRFRGSFAAAFAQGIILGNYINGFRIANGQFAGTSWDWCIRSRCSRAWGGGGLHCSERLGWCWKTEGDLQAWARRQARRALAITGLFIVVVSLYSPFAHPRIYARWFDAEHWLWLAPLPLATLALFGRRTRPCGAGARKRVRSWPRWVFCPYVTPG